MSGISRPVVGALSGVALFVSVDGNIVPLKVGAGPVMVGPNANSPNGNRAATTAQEKPNI